MKLIFNINILILSLILVYKGYNSLLFKYIIRFLHFFRAKIIKNIINKVNLLMKPLSKTESKKYINIMYNFSVFGLLMEMLLNIQLLWVNKINYSTILFKQYAYLIDKIENIDEIIQKNPKIWVNKPNFDKIRRLVFFNLKNNFFIS